MSNDANIQTQAQPVNAKLVFDSAALTQPGGAARFDHLYERGYRLKGIVSLKRDGSESKFDPVAVALLKRRGSDTIFTSVIYERGGEWFYADAVPYVRAQ